MDFLVRLFNVALFCAVGIAACVGLYRLAQVNLVTELAPGQEIPRSFGVVVEVRGKDRKPSYEVRPFHGQDLRLLPGESLHLGKASWDQMDEDPTGSCCASFKVLADGPDGQLVEVHDDDMSDVMSRYRVRNGKVTPVAHSLHSSLYYFGYLFGGIALGWLLTRSVRRRTLAWARARRAQTSHIQ